MLIVLLRTEYMYKYMNSGNNLNNEIVLRDKLALSKYMYMDKFNESKQQLISKNKQN